MCLLHRVLPILLVILALPDLRNLAAQSLDPGEWAVVRVDANLRSGPGKRFSVRRVLLEGTRVRVRRCQDSWCAVDADESRGYVYRPLLKRVAEPQVRRFFRLPGVDAVNRWTMVAASLLLPLLWVVLLLAPATGGAEELTPRGHLLAFLLFVVMPGVYLAAQLFGEPRVVQSTPFQLATVFFNVSEIVLFFGLLAQAFTLRSPYAVVSLILLIGTSSVANDVSELGGMLMNIAAAAIGWDSLLFEWGEMQPGDRVDAMDFRRRFFQ